MIHYLWIIKDTGESLFYKNFTQSRIELDENLFSGFFIALNTFAKESGKGAIDSITLQNAKYIYMNIGPIFVVLGCDPSDEIGKVRVFMNNIGNKFLDMFGNLENFQGNIDLFRPFSNVFDDKFIMRDLVPDEVPQYLKDEIETEPNGKDKITYKTVIVGSAGVGKTSLLSKFAKDRFNSEYKPTLGVDIVKYSYAHNSKLSVTFTAWDVSGQRSFKNIRRNYYPNTESFLIVYDVSDLESFEEIDNWVDEIQHYGNKDGIYLLIGNKKDLKGERLISADQGIEKANALGFEYFETSAKTGQNVQELFHYLGDKILERRNIRIPGILSN